MGEEVKEEVVDGWDVSESTDTHLSVMCLLGFPSSRVTPYPQSRLGVGTNGIFVGGRVSSRVKDGSPIAPESISGRQT